MFKAIALLLLLLAVPVGVNVTIKTDAFTALRMQHREEYLEQQMALLTQDIEQYSSVEEITLLSELLPLLFWTFVGALVLVGVVVCVVRKMDLDADLCSEQDGSSSEEEDDNTGEDLSGAPGGVSSLPLSPVSPMQDLPDTCKVLKELVGDLLCHCRTLCKRSLLPQMHPVTGTKGPYEEWTVQENNITYQLFVCLQPPPGHSFTLEMDTTGQLPGRSSRVHVALECICSSRQLLGESLCFLHHPDNKLPRDQSSCLLRTLCTDSYLDLEKVACWAQMVVSTAWPLLPESQHCQLTVLPSSQSCKFQLTGMAEMNICTEIRFGVKRDS